MPLDWDIKLDAVSIKDEIVSFNIKESKGSYVRELILFSASPDFYDQFVYTELPTARIEVLTKISSSWISQGKFFIEKPVLIVNADSTTSPGIWGRSETAKLGPPFAQKVSRYYDSDTTFMAVINEMAALCDITITFEISDAAIVANTYVIDNKYPIDVIVELVEFGAGYVIGMADGGLLIKQDIFHPSIIDQTFVDSDIADISENVDIPEFGNRIRVSALGGLGSGYTITLMALDDGDCLAADSESTGTLLAFVMDQTNSPVPDNTLVNWSIGDGATLAHEQTNTGNYLLTNRKHAALNYYSVEVEFPIVDVIGVWAYADMGNRFNYWDSSCSFDGNIITLDSSLDFCDQALRVTYITGGCAVNVVTAGYTVMDIEVTAEIEGATDTLEIRLGNTCACGSNLDIRKNPSDAICIGFLAHILVWATINNKPAVGYSVHLRKESGCGELSSENKILKTASILNEASFIRNEITGVSQVDTAIIPVSTINPKVYLKSDTEKTNDLYSSHLGNLIDLSSVQSTGNEVVVDYTADGATLVAWRTLEVTKDCEAEIVATMADGTEAGLRQMITMNAKDCTIPDEIPDHYEDVSDFDPDFDDQGGGDGGGGGFPDSGNGGSGDSGDSGGGSVDPCDAPIINSILNADDAATDDARDGHRFSASSDAYCPPEGEEWECSCADLCDAEVERRGGTYESSQTIHEVVSESHEKGTSAYNEAFETEKQSQLSACAESCDDKREKECGNCELVSGAATLAPGESAEFVCSDGSSAVITMPEGCGVQTFTIGCCTFEVRSTNGHWVLQSYDAVEIPPGTPNFCGGVSGGCSYANVQEDPNKAGTSSSGHINCFYSGEWTEGVPCYVPTPVSGGGNCETDCAVGTIPGGPWPAIPLPFTYTVYRWVCYE